MFRNKFFAALPFLHDLDDSNLEEAFPTISDSPDGRDFKGSKVKQVSNGRGVEKRRGCVGCGEEERADDDPACSNP